MRAYRKIAVKTSILFVFACILSAGSTFAQDGVSLGLGGAGAVLSSTFLRIFDEFSYRRLGMSCRLSRGVCEMAGVAPAENGYYIVEGGGLPPRIDVIGFNERVDWPVLLGRLKQINRTEGPVIR